MDYDHGAWLLCTKNVMLSYSSVNAKADVALMNGDRYLLLMQVEKVISSTSCGIMVYS